MPVRMRPVIVLNLKLTNPLKGRSKFLFIQKSKEIIFAEQKNRMLKCPDDKCLMPTVSVGMRRNEVAGAPMPVIKKATNHSKHQQ